MWSDENCTRGREFNIFSMCVITVNKASYVKLLYPFTHCRCFLKDLSPTLQRPLKFESLKNKFPANTFTVQISELIIDRNSN